MQFAATAVIFMSTVSAGPGDGPLCSKSSPKNPKYLDKKLPTQARVADLLAHLCWEEKVAQLGGIGGLLSINSTYNVESYQKIARLHNGTICKWLSPAKYPTALISIRESKAHIVIMLQLRVNI